MTGGFDSAIALSASGQPTRRDRNFQPDLDYRGWNFDHDDDSGLVHSARHLHDYGERNFGQHHGNHHGLPNGNRDDP